MVTTIRPSLASDGVKQSFDEVGNFTVISFAIPPLSPNSSFGLTLPFSFVSTLRDLSFPIQIENTTVTPHIKVLFQNRISVTIHTGNLPSKLYKLSMSAISAQNLPDGIQKFSALEPVSPKKHIIDSILDLFKYVEFNVTNFVSFEIDYVLQNAEHKLFVMKSSDRYSRYGWLNLPSNDIKKLSNLEVGCIVGFIDLEKIPRSQRKFRLREGNLIKK